MKIPFYATYIDPSAREKITSILDSSFLGEGKQVKKFETLLSKKLGIANPIALNSGTSALHLALILAGVKPDDEVICPAQTFIATGMAILYCGARPIFADIQYETGNIDYKSIEKKVSSKTKAIVIVHWAGYPCDINEIHTIAKKRKLVVIEDAAHALGATYKGRPIGSISEFTCFSFQSIKHLTTGDGGAICCTEHKKAEEASKLRWFGINRDSALPSILGERIFNTNKIGYKYHLNDYAATLGLANLETFKKRLDKRRKIASRYRLELGKVSGIHLFKEENDRESSYWLFGFHVDKRNNFIKALKFRGVPTSVVHQRIDQYKVFGGVNKNLFNQKKFDEKKIHIPIHDQLTENQINHIINSIKLGW